MDYERLIANRMKGVKASAIREIFKVAGMPGMISFAGGMPAPESFAPVEIAEICADILKNDPVGALQYSVSEGYPPLRETIANRIKSKFGIGTPDDVLLVVSGSQQGMDITAKALLNEGDGVVCEEPSFIGSLNTFRTYHATLYGVPMEEDGMDMGKLEETLKAHSNIKIIYTIPTFQNPSGITMSVEKRKRMIELAQQYNVIILEDNPYGELSFEGQNIPNIKSFDTEGCVVYVGSFSKIFSPGLRLAYVVFNKGLNEKMVIGKQATDVHTNIFAQMVLNKFLTEYNIDAYIQKSRELYKHRCHLMLETMDRCFPEGVSYTRPTGGLFIWVTLPAGMDAQALMAEATQRHVAFVPGNAFMTDVDAPSNAFRLNYSTMPDDKITEGIEILGKLLTEKLQ